MIYLTSQSLFISEDRNKQWKCP